MIAVISDIHGNLEALRSVLRRVEDADAVYCAGDVVGYGPSPNECCELVRERDVQCVMGNHDFVCANLHLLDSESEELSDEDRALLRRMYEGKNTAAQASSVWTNEALTEENREWLRNLPVRLSRDGMTLLHGRPGSKSDMLNEYVLPGHGTADIGETADGRLLVLGHSHLPMRTERIVNPGSVGQPRDRNWKASYAVFRDVWWRFTYIREDDMSFRIISQSVDIHRTPYDIDETMRKIKAAAELPDSLAERLPVGL